MFYPLSLHSTRDPICMEPRSVSKEATGDDSTDAEAHANIPHVFETVGVSPATSQCSSIQYSIINTRKCRSVFRSRQEGCNKQLGAVCRQSSGNSIFCNHSRKLRLELVLKHIVINGRADGSSNLPNAKR